MLRGGEPFSIKGDILMSNAKGAMDKRGVVKNSICYMCTDRCPTKVHVRQEG